MSDGGTCLKDVPFVKDKFWLTRIVFLRCLAFIYCVAFSVALSQNGPLIGEDGILPVSLYMNRLRSHFNLESNEVNLEGFLAAPTVFWWVPAKHTDVMLDAISTMGLVISVAVLFQGAANMITMAALWALYHCLVNVGQRWYSFGWESQLLETGFLAIWVVPLFSMNALPKDTPTSTMCVFGYRWLLFRIMLGAGLIKVRGDMCWRDLTCMNYHYETQPVPNPFSWFFHYMPSEWHMLETAGNHVIELLVPWLLLVPHRSVVAFGGAMQILFQSVLILSGNLSFLNWLTMLPAIFCFDDGHYSSLFSKVTLNLVRVTQHLSAKGATKIRRRQRGMCNTLVGALILFLSIPVIQNLFSAHQQMNTSFDSFRIVNTYGAFGSITKERTEVIIEGTTSTQPKDGSGEVEWKEYEFHCKPGSVSRRPCLISPYHYRLDWLMWFAAFQEYQHNPWFLNFIGKLLEGNEGVRRLIAHDPFANSTALPRYIRAQHYKYTYSLEQWWQRTYLKPYMPPVDLAGLRSYRTKMGWLKSNKKETPSPPLNITLQSAGVLVVVFSLLMALFKREMNSYCDQSISDDVDEMMSRATKLDKVLAAEGEPGELEEVQEKIDLASQRLREEEKTEGKTEDKTEDKTEEEIGEKTEDKTEGEKKED